MAKNTNNEDETPIVEAQIAPEPVVATSQEKSPEYLAFANTIEKYKISNPSKYEVKKEALSAKLNTL